MASRGSSLWSWYEARQPRRVNMIGDFAGQELCGIHGDSLLLHCLNEARVDYQDGFQLLHAIHAVERFLSNLAERGCNFHVLWFSSHENIGAQAHVGEGRAYKYRLTRAILVRHLNEQANAGRPRKLCFLFPSLDSKGFHDYLNQNTVRYFLCSDGCSVGNKGQRLHFLDVLYRLSKQGYSVALIDDVEFQSSMVYTNIVSPETGPAELKISEPDPPGRMHFTIGNGLVDVNDVGSRLRVQSGREAVAIAALSVVLQGNSNPAIKLRAAAFLAHVVILRHCRLSERRCRRPFIDKMSDHFMDPFCSVAVDLISRWPDQRSSPLVWDLYDLLDGRLLSLAVDKLQAATLSDSVLSGARELAAHVAGLSDVDISEYLQPTPDREEALRMTAAVLPGRSEAGVPHRESELGLSVLPFSHPDLDGFLGDVALDPSVETGPSNRPQIFYDRTHWHNSKKLIDPKHPPQRRGYHAMKREQKFKTDTLAYAASLTNSAGKLIDPETIVTLPPRRDSTIVKAAKAKGKENFEVKQTTSKVRQTKMSKASGRERAAAEARALKVEKLGARSSAVANFWKDQCRVFDKEADLVKRHTACEKFLNGLSKADGAVIGSEVALYLCNILVWMLKKDPSGPSNQGVIAMIWFRLQDLTRSSLSRECAAQREQLALALRLPVHPLRQPPEFSRPLAYIPLVNSTTKQTGLPATTLDPVEFQLEHCGPYLERSFDPAPDPRVPFSPDAWQRKVLDGIDDDESLFVVAPTSAGKTFISFYAMKQVLQVSDDGILVYVAPTKALVNQIAAEVEARFSKSYSRDGRSVWAIHTRDYRINNPTGCQVLVTVPHILQIMLLAPSNAERENSWSYRIKRVIFDEVHCIGQADDGVIWEQLLLLAPCPIIALSATVGNPMEFKSWLEGSEKAKGRTLEMIIHTSRYSDLRKYMYRPPDEFVFNGFSRRDRLPVPGLGEDDNTTERSPFRFVHPIAGLIDRSRETLDDISLEPRDCLALWRCMERHQTQQFPLSSSLGPSNFLPAVVTKYGVTCWEAALKECLLSWMRDFRSPFEAVWKEFHSVIVPKPVSDTDAPSERSKSDDAEDLICAKYGGWLAVCLPLLLDLHVHGALPALVFSYDRVQCEEALLHLLGELERAEQKWKDTSPEWAKTLSSFEKWSKAHSKTQAKKTKDQMGASAKGTADDSVPKGMDAVRDAGSKEVSKWESFDANAPLEKFSFADKTKLSDAELEQYIQSLRPAKVRGHFIDGLRRGLGVHHAGMNRQYRQVVEILFRRGFLSVVIATGTLALGINMPCKTVVFAGDSVFLTALNYRQASGRAGRRGFDLLGNVVFLGIPRPRALEIMSSRLPDLRGHFPISTTLLLRLLSLLHHTNRSEFARRGIDSLLSQTRLYLGGPDSQMAIKHHVRFSIEYLRRQHLLSAEGAPLNFCGLVGHLYFTENSVFALHSLLKEGYFHRLCADIDRCSKDVLLTLMLVLSHIFCRIPCPRFADEEWRERVVRRSSSIVILPPLPGEAEEILRGHNRESLSVFRGYVQAYVRRHLADQPDCALPFTGHKINPAQPWNREQMMGGPEGHQTAPTEIRSPFTALSGFGDDDFASVRELCTTARGGVALEESAVPYMAIYPSVETGGVPLNAYVYDFFRHGDMKQLVQANGIKAGDVWFFLKDFSLVLATIVASLTNFLGPGGSGGDGAGDMDMLDMQGSEGWPEDEAGAVSGAEDEEFGALPLESSAGKLTDKGNMEKMTKKKKKKSKVLDSWEDNSESESDSGSRDEVGVGDEAGETASIGASGTAPPAWAGDGEEGLKKVLKAFTLLRDEFEQTFRKVWA